MNFTLKAANIWEFGARKDAVGNPHQEDNLYPPAGTVPDSARLFIVCDGMGGHDAGEVASATVVKSLSEAIPTDSEEIFTEQSFRKALANAYDALDTIECGASRKPGTTLALLKLHAGGATIAHIGDSRVYHIRPGDNAARTRILHMTSDHSLVNELVKLGELTEEQARTSSQRNVITRAMQPKLSPRPSADLHTTPDVRPGDWFYLCSDGMLEQMTDSELRSIFSTEGGDMEQKKQALMKATLHNQDNHTGILVNITGVTGTAAKRPETSMLTPDMSRAAQAVFSHMEEDEQPAKASGKRSLTIPILLAIAALLAAIAIWFYCLSPTETKEGNRSEAEPAETAVEQVATMGAPAEQPAVLPEAREAAPPSEPSEPRTSPKPETHENMSEQPVTRQHGQPRTANELREPDRKKVIREDPMPQQETPADEKTVNNTPNEKNLYD